MNQVCEVQQKLEHFFHFVSRLMKRKSSRLLLITLVGTFFIFYKTAPTDINYFESDIERKDSLFMGDSTVENREDFIRQTKADAIQWYFRFHFWTIK